PSAARHRQHRLSHTQHSPGIHCRVTGVVAVKTYRLLRHFLLHAHRRVSTSAHRSETTSAAGSLPAPGWTFQSAKLRISPLRRSSRSRARSIVAATHCEASSCPSASTPVSDRDISDGTNTPAAPEL